MEDLNSQFEKAADGAKSLPGKPSNDTLLIIYALFKQATVGDINTSNFSLTQKSQASSIRREEPNGVPGRSRRARPKTMLRRSTSTLSLHST